MPPGRPPISGPGPWGSLVPALPSVPSQALEGIATLGILAVLTLALMARRVRSPRRPAVLLGDRPVGRGRAAVVSTTWRDPAVAGRLNAGGLISVGIAIGCAAALVAAHAAPAVAGRRDRRRRPPRPASELAWPDPETRPRF